jgi:hypothetical protein
VMQAADQLDLSVLEADPSAASSPVLEAGV